MAADVDVHLNPAALKELLNSVEVARELERRAIRVETAAKRLCPVDTGRLRASITHKAGADDEGLFVDIGTDVTYGIFVELGTLRNPGQPFLRPAIAAAGDAGV